MAFEKGNKAAVGRRNPVKLFEQALKRALLAEDGRALRRVAERLVELAEGGEIQAIREVADRVDGKPHQTATVESFVHNVRNISDDELAAIATGSGAGTASEAESAGQSQSVH